MRRKIIQIGDFTKSITLPKGWVTKLNIQKGDEVILEEEGNKLVISPTSISPLKKKASLDLSKKYEYNIRLTKTMYRCGYDEVAVQFDDADMINKIQNVLSEQLVGFEIIDQEEKRCVVKDIVGESESDINTILRRLFLLTLSMGKESYDAISSNDLKRLNEIQAMERMNNKLCNLCERILNKKGYEKEPIKMLFIHALTKELEQIADNYRDLCKYLLTREKVKVSEDILKTYKEANELFNEAYKLFYNIDYAFLSKHKNKKWILKKKAYDLLSKKKGDDQIILHHIIILILKTIHLDESII